MARKTAPARYIKASSIQLGDTIRITGTWHDMEMSRKGTVAKRTVDPRSGTTEWITAQGIVLHTVFKDGSSPHPARVITLLNRVADLTLPGLENV